MLDFIRALLFLLDHLLLATSTASADRSGHYSTSTVSARSQWALPQQQAPIAVTTTEINPQAPDHSAQLPDLNCAAPDRSGHCRTSTRQIAVGTIGPQHTTTQRNHRHSTQPKTTTAVHEHKTPPQADKPQAQSQAQPHTQAQSHKHTGTVTTTVTNTQPQTHNDNTQPAHNHNTQAQRQRHDHKHTTTTI